MISDHAVKRYFKRKLGEDIKDEDIERERQKLITPALRLAIKEGACALKVDGGRFMITEGVVTTFLPTQFGLGGGKKRGPLKSKNMSRKYYRAKKLGVYK